MPYVRAANDNPSQFYYFRSSLGTESLRIKKKIQVLNTLLPKSSFADWNKAITQLSANYLDQIIW